MRFYSPGCAFVRPYCMRFPFEYVCEEIRDCSVAVAVMAVAMRGKKEAPPIKLEYGLPRWLSLQTASGIDPGQCKDTASCPGGLTFGLYGTRDIVGRQGLVTHHSCASISLGWRWKCGRGSVDVPPPVPSRKTHMF